MTLSEYERKRDPKKTPEPFGGKRKTKDPIFVVQRHDARRLHYDFRLERDGALASWAVPKGVPLEPGQQHLAVQVEDHPLEYASFEGEIPKGQYGAGTVEIWDQGTYELVEEKRNGGLTVRLHGNRLEGTWALVPAKLDGDPKNWLIIRKRDDGAVAPRPAGHAEYKPMLATLAADLPKGDGWLFEVKWDGYRAIGRVSGGEATLTSRNGNDLTARFANVAKELPKALKTPGCVVDGEVCALDEQGRSSFSAMQQGKPGTPIVYYVFDLHEVGGEPRLVAEVEFAQWTHDGHLRAPVYQGLREDKEPEEVQAEVPEEPLPNELRKGRRSLKLSNLDKPFWPDEGITKGDLLDYYRRVAPVLVPQLRDRPFTMRRYPDGAYGKAFFQKDAPVHMPEWIPRVPLMVSTRETPRRRKRIQAPLVNDDLALLWMANMGCIDMNTWYSRVDKPDRPDWVLFDLDPSPNVGFAETIEVALYVKEALDALGLVSFPKTSGSEGIHVLVPIERRHTYDDTREFAEIVAGAIARAHRGLATTEWSKAKRRGVLIDSNQNGEGKTIASAYSVRPKPGAPVSTPLRWDEVNEKLNPAIYTMDVVLSRVEQHGDLFEGVLTTRQRLGEALKAFR